MTEIRGAENHVQPGGFTKRSVLFLSISGGLLLVLLVAVREVLLPFLLALIIAYVLMPLVVLGERRLRLPRSVSILSVYTVVLGALTLSVVALAPRLYVETVRFVREAPHLVQSAAERHGDRIESWVNAYRPAHAARVPREPQPALRIVTREDGTQAVEVGSGLSVVEEAPGRYRVLGREEAPAGRFQVSELVDQGLEKFVRYVELNALHVLKVGRALVSEVSRALLLFFMVLMVAGYLMHTREGVLGFFRSLLPARHRPGFAHWLARVDRGLSGVVRGQLLICLVNGLLSAVGFWFFGLHYWPVLALVAGVLSIIPIFGAILSSVPAVLVGFTQDMWVAVFVLAWILFIHQIEANLLNPKIIGVSAKIHPVLVVFSLLVGEHYFGLWGALLAVPFLSVIQSTFNHFRFALLEDTGPDSLGVERLLAGSTPPPRPPEG